MKSPKDMRIIQIDITNACINQCSNCTRFCGHHKKPFFMDWETFTRAVDSLKDFDRTIGIMGGEPTIHPQFQRFVQYIGEQYPSKVKLPPITKPIRNFIKYIRDRNFYLDETLNDRKGPGLWTSLCNNYYEHFELIQDVFSYQCINDHQNPSRHQPLLISRKDVGVSDDKWIEIRDKCWFQNMWSATITPKGAFFCEIAGALDMLFDGPGGWPIEPGWWKRDPKDFGDQLNWCELCGGALLNKGRFSYEEIDDVSKTLFEKLKEVGSPKQKRNKVNILSIKNLQSTGEEMPDTINRYLPDFQERISRLNTVLNPKTIDAVIFCNSKEILENKIDSYTKAFNSVVLASESYIYNDFIKTVSSKSNIYTTSTTMNQWGRTLNKAIKLSSAKDWVCLIDEDTKLCVELLERFKTIILNPGVLYRFSISELKDKMVLFNTRAKALKIAGYDGISACNSADEFFGLWDEDKTVFMDGKLDDVIQNPDLELWVRIAENIESQNKAHVYKCLDKIKSDHE